MKGAAALNEVIVGLAVVEGRRMWAVRTLVATSHGWRNELVVGTGADVRCALDGVTDVRLVDGRNRKLLVRRGATWSTLAISGGDELKFERDLGEGELLVDHSRSSLWIIRDTECRVFSANLAKRHSFRVPEGYRPVGVGGGQLCGLETMGNVRYMSAFTPTGKKTSKIIEGDLSWAGEWRDGELAWAVRQNFGTSVYGLRGDPSGIRVPDLEPSSARHPRPILMSETAETVALVRRRGTAEFGYIGGRATDHDPRVTRPPDHFVRDHTSRTPLALYGQSGGPTTLATIATVGEGLTVGESHWTGNAPAELVSRSEAIDYSVDNSALPCRVRKPAGPISGVFIYLHGGPRSVSRPEWLAQNSFLDLIVKQNWLTCEPNFSGSLCYGDDHERTGIEGWGVTAVGEICGLVKKYRAASRGVPIVVGGYSYGAYVALKVGVRMPSVLAGIICAGGAYDLVRWNKCSPFAPAYLIEECLSPEDLPSLSPLLEVHEGLPPVKILHGEADEINDVWQARALAKRLEEVGVDASLKTYPDMRHDFNRSSSPNVMREYILDICFALGNFQERWKRQ